ncbi:MAG: ABC transporter substrate-binding protein [Rickettsiales bacterium]|jgi:ABC-type amino acid transport substrate-binding protein|nr:ABC transporter substrate-binding protein [Rickettsiales bacterium]
MKKYFYIVFLFLFLIPLGIADTLKVAIDPSYPPFALANEDETYDGFEVDVAKALAKDLNMDIKFFNLEYPAALVSLTTNKADLIVTVDKSDLKEGKVFFSSPVMSSGYSVIVNSSNKVIKNREDLRGKKIGGIQGTQAIDAITRLYPDFNIIYFDSADVMYESLAQNKIDAVVNDSVVNDYYVKNSPRSSKVKTLIPEFDSANGFMAISIKREKLYNDIESSLKKLEKNGTMKSIREKWSFKAPLQ